MLTTNVKQQINTARDILVGKIPDPKGQIDQITNALIYKFMDDQDRLALTLPNGKPSFFVNELKPYAWHKLFDTKLSNQDKANLYVEGIAKLSVCKHLPDLFRDIFKDAYLPFRAPDTIAMFLNEINKFDYHHSEDLGNAFEYLLSIMGSQGDAGQFRTPRNIIEFIVDAVDPSKDDHILDPACGTAGFLVEAYKHITKDKKLTPNEVQELAKHIHGVDIDPGMAKIARVNLYLHGFKTPLITEDDTLSDEKLWGTKYDVILANPPFMTPKGGIVPHDKFSIKANKAEILFTDYIAEHLKLAGRAGIVVPDGIINTSANAYKQLRKMLVDDNYLWGVVSLPAGVFNPYSGVKTSILLLDRERATKNKEILFFKVDNDGFDLGAQRREIAKNDLPDALEAVKKWKNGEKVENIKALYIEKGKIAESGDYNLSGDRYRVATDYTNAKWLMVELGGVCELHRGVVYSKDDEVSNNGHKILRANNISLSDTLILDDIKLISRDLKLKDSQKLRAEDIFICLASGSKDHVGKVAYIPNDTDFYFGGFMGAIRVKEKTISPQYLFHLLKDQKFNDFLGQEISGANINNLNFGILSRYQIPLPPLEIQEQIVAELDGYAGIIAGAKQIVGSWKPSFKVDAEWEIKNLSDVCTQITDGTHQTPKYTNEGVPFLRVTDITKSNDSKKYLSEEEHKELIKRCKPEKGNVLYTKNGTIGIAKMIDWDYEFSIFVSLALLKPKKQVLEGKYLEHFLNSGLAMSQAMAHSKAGTITNLHLIEIKQFQIPLPPLAIQKQIVEKIEAECALVESSKKLIKIYEQKTKESIAKLWAE